MVMYLLSKGPWPAVRDFRGETALTCAAGEASTKMLRGLLEHMAGQGLNARSSDGKTALHCAVLYDEPDNLRALLVAGADPTIVDNDGRTSRQCAGDCTRRKSLAVFKVSIHKYYLSRWIIL
jgi:ankyrin repeat protein